MKVLVTGGAGYIGSVLAELLLEEKHDVTCLDRFFFGNESVEHLLGEKGFEVVRDDIRWFNPSLLRGQEAVLDLAALSNDPAGEIDPVKTREINHEGRVRVASLSKKHGVERYVLASSCSAYGHRDGSVVDEESRPNPLTTYARCNVMAENDVMPLADRNFAVTSLRQATVYGLSNRMRFDLAVNAMVLSIHNEGRIPVMRDGTQWRPFVHVKDAALAFLKVLEAESEDVNGHVFNVGSDDQNYQIGTLAEEIGRSIRVPYEVVLYGDPDKRSYRVSFDKIDRILGFRPRYSPREGAKEINRALAEGEVEESMSSHTLKWYIHLLRHEEEFQHLTVGGRLL